MTKEKLLEIIHRDCESESNVGPWYSLSGYKSVSFRISTMEPYYNLQAIEQLPSKYYFPKRKKTFCVDIEGISYKGVLYKWEEILLTGIKSVNERYQEYPLEYFVIGLKNGNYVVAEPGHALFSITIEEFGHITLLYKKKYRLLNFPS